MDSEQATPEQPQNGQHPLKCYIDPDLLEWARQTLDMEEVMADLREIEATGGIRLEDVIEEIEQRVRRRG
jgi:hypothetical protein